MNIHCSLFQAGRGLTVDVALVDEAAFAKDLSTQMAYVTGGTKIVLTSSIKTSSDKTSFLLKTHNSGAPYYHVCSSCEADSAKMMSLSDAIACDHFYLSMPPYVYSDTLQKRVMNSLRDNMFATEQMGITKGCNDPILPGNNQNIIDTLKDPHTRKTFVIDANCILDASVIHGMRFYTTSIDTFSYINDLSTTLVMYVDPAYTANENASATGIAVVSTTEVNGVLKIVGLHLENYSLPDHKEPASDRIGALAAGAINTLSNLYRLSDGCPHFRTAIIAVEDNSCEANCVRVCSMIDKLLGAVCPHLTVKFLHRPFRTKDLTAMGFVVNSGDNLNQLCSDLPGFHLSSEKSIAFDNFILDANAGNIVMAMLVTSHTIASNGQIMDHSPSQYLSYQLEKVRYKGKVGNQQDDVAVAFILAHYIWTNITSLASLIHKLESGNNDGYG